MATSKKNQGSLNIEEALNNSEAFFVKYQKAILYAVAAIIIVIAGFILYKNYVAQPRENKASTTLAKGQEYFGQEQFDKALNGDGMGYPGFVKIADDYSSTKAGNLANLYAGLSYAQMGKFDQAAKFLEEFDTKDDQMISPAAMGALGNCYAHLHQLDKAVECLKKAAKMADNNSLSPTFLIQAGEILESQGKKNDALEMYKEVKQKYFKSMQYQDIDKYIERASQE
jgi:tetratricopeptide (TPR) repeat protein